MLIFGGLRARRRRASSAGRRRVRCLAQHPTSAAKQTRAATMGGGWSVGGGSQIGLGGETNPTAGAERTHRQAGRSPRTNPAPDETNPMGPWEGRGDVAVPRTNPAPPARNEAKRVGSAEWGAESAARRSRRRTNPMVVWAIPHVIQMLIPPVPNEANGNMVKREKVDRQPGARRAAARNEPNGALGDLGRGGGHRRPSRRSPRTNPAPVSSDSVQGRVAAGPGPTSPNEPSAVAEPPHAPRGTPHAPAASPNEPNTRRAT
jgi:hypothetical protein